MDAVRPKKATSIDVRGMRANEAFEQILQGCLRHAALNAGLIHEDVPEAVHQTRIGFRRARSAIALFKPYLKKKPRKTVYGELRKAGQYLAPARDWDVFCCETLPRLAKRFPELTCEQLVQLQQRTERKRLSAYEELRMDIIATTGQHITLDVTDPIEMIAPDLLDGQYFNVRRAFRHIDTPEQRHALRKAMKKLRYSVEFLGSLYEPKAVNSFLHHCKEAQGILGKMNDAHTMINLLTELETDDSVTVLLNWAKRKQDKADLDLVHTRSDFRGAKPFWD